MQDPTIEDEEDLLPSRSQKKREAQAVYQLARKLVEISDRKLKKLPLETEMRTLVRKVKGIKAHVARKRETQFLAKHLRELPEEIISDLMNMDTQTKKEVNFTRVLDQWLEYLEKPSSSVDPLYQHYSADLCAQLRPIVRKLQKMYEQENSPLKLKVKRQLREKLTGLSSVHSLPEPPFE